MAYSEEDNKAFARLKDFEQVQVFEGLVEILLPQYANVCARLIEDDRHSPVLDKKARRLAVRLVK